jgi:hypothetical protein
VIWRNLDWLKPNLQWRKNTPAGKTPETGANPCGRVCGYLLQTFGAGTMSSEDIQGDEWAA